MVDITEYDASNALSAFFPEKNERRTARVWAIERAIQDLAAVGMVTLFEGAGTDPTGLSGYANTKLWLNPDSGITATPGTVRYWNGTSPETDISNWPALTIAGFRSHLSVYSEAEVDALIAGGLPTFTSDNFSNESSVTGATITDALDALLTALGDYLPTSQKGAASGVASLDGDGKLTASQIPDSITSPFRFIGTWNASTNVLTPVDGGSTYALSDGVGTEGDLFRVSTAGTTSLDGEASWAAGDEGYFGGDVWNKLAGTAAASSSTPTYSDQDTSISVIASRNDGGNQYQVAVTTDQRILIWGDVAAFAFNPVGDWYAGYELPVPWDIDTVTIEAVYPGINYLLVQTDESTGNLYHIGASDHGQGGNGGTSAVTELTQISAFSAIHIDEVWNEANRVNVEKFWFALTSSGAVYSCGYSGAQHVMGYNSTTNLTTPRLMTESDGSTPLANIVEVSCDTAYAPVWARTSDNKAWRWGAGTDGAHGNNSTSAMTWPDLLETAPSSGTDRTDIAQIVVAGGSNAATRAVTWIRTTAGKIEVSGSRFYGNGDGTALTGGAVNTFQSAAGTIAGLTTSKLIAGGGEYYNCVAITSTGNGYICGYMASHALLGDGATTNLNTFTIFSSLPSNFAGNLTDAQIMGGNTNTAIYLEATISGAKSLASIGFDSQYETGKGTSVAAAAQTWGTVDGARGVLDSWAAFGAYDIFGIVTLNSSGELRYAGGNSQGQSGVLPGQTSHIPILQPVRSGLPRLLKAPQHRGAYSAVTEYSYQDEVENNGSTWRYRNVSASTGNAPPTLPTTSNTYWQLTAQAGSDGVSLEWEGAWVTSTAYAVQDGVENDGSSYICTVAHTSGASTEPGVGASWATVWDLSAAKGGTGDPGADGVDPGILLTWDTANDDSNPGSGEIKASVADLSSDGTLYINDSDRSSNSIRAFLATLYDTDQGGTIYLTRTSDGVQAVLTVSGAVTQVTDYSKVPFTHDSGATSFSASDAVSLLFARGGNDGAGTGDVTSSSTITDNRIVRGDGGSKGVQESAAAIDDSGNIVPSSDDGSSLGTSALKWSDLFLASGAVVNWDNGNVTLTHSLGALSFGTSLALTLGSIELGHASDTTIARSGAGDITIEGNAVYRAGGTDVAIADGGTGAGTAAAAFTNLKQAASLTETGVVELGTAAEINTGSDTARVPSINELRQSNYGVAIVTLLVFDDSEDVSTGNGAGDIWYRVPSVLNGWDLVGVAASCQTAGTTGNMDIMVHNVTQAADMLSTAMRIETGETDTATSAQPGTIDTANDDVATGDQIRIDVDAVQTTPAKGLQIELQFRLP